MENKEKTRYIKTIIFTSINNIYKIEPTINQTVETIREYGGKVISIIPHNWGISPMNMIYNIIYESNSQINFVEDDDANEE